MSQDELFNTIKKMFPEAVDISLSRTLYLTGTPVIITAMVYRTVRQSQEEESTFFAVATTCQTPEEVIETLVKDANHREGVRRALCGSTL